MFHYFRLNSPRVLGSYQLFVSNRGYYSTSTCAYTHPFSLRGGDIRYHQKKNFRRDLDFCAAITAVFFPNPSLISTWNPKKVREGGTNSSFCHTARPRWLCVHFPRSAMAVPSRLPCCRRNAASLPHHVFDLDRHSRNVRIHSRRLYKPAIASCPLPFFTLL